MELLNRGSERAVKLVRKAGWDRRDAYRLSGFCIPYEEDGVCLLKNTLTEQIYRLTGEEYAALGPLREGNRDADYIRENGLEELAVSRCVVGVDYDERAEYLSALHVLRLMEPPAEGFESYVVFPTTACNARCVYCFEKDFVPVTMSEDTALAAASYIDRTRRKGPVRLRWFGGEPLAAASRIDLICRELEKRGVEFVSSITTNGSLLDADMAARAVSLWRLKKAEVALEGDRGAYEARKRYLDPERHNFDTVLRAVRLLLERDVDIILRCNYDAGNLGGLYRYVEELHREFGDFENIRLSFAVLHQEYGSGNAPGLVRQIREVEDYALSLGLRLLSQENAAFQTRACMADNMDRSVVIEPGGQLQHCDILDDENRFGNVWDGVTDRARYEALKRPHAVEAECGTCPFLPECTPFRRTGCPITRLGSCRGILREATENGLHRMAATLQREPPTEGSADK